MTWVLELFMTVAKMSITASYVAIGVIIVRLLLKNSPKIFSYILWAPVLYRLLCPFSFSSTFSFFNIFSREVKHKIGAYYLVAQNTGTLDTSGIQASIDKTNSMVGISHSGATIMESTNTMQIWLSAFSLIWIFGVASIVIYSIFSYVKIKGKLKMATRLEGNVYETDAIGTAFVCGFIRPKIYIPANLEDSNLSYILEHERTHIHRKDYLIKLVAFIALILHWFNPLMWLSFTLMSQDMEMSCDENVLCKLGDGAKGGYSKSLLSQAMKKKGFLTAGPLAFGENYVKTRIKNVLNFKKPAFWVIVASVFIVFAATIAFAANPDENTIYISEYYKISLKYPSYWKRSTNYDEKFEGEDGFFQLGAINGKGMTLDEVTKMDAFHMLQPYGSDPQIINYSIDGQEARLILPSADQAQEMNNQAGLIVKYPEAVKISNSEYHYLILWADKAHIKEIGTSIKFLSR